MMTEQLLEAAGWTDVAGRAKLARRPCATGRAAGEDTVGPWSPRLLQLLPSRWHSRRQWRTQHLWRLQQHQKPTLKNKNERI